MVFSSSIFLLFFLPFFLLVYYRVGKRFKNYVIILASILFYAWGAPKFIFVILGTTILDFYLVNALFKNKDQTKRKLLLFSSILLNVGLLAYFKYANFFIENLNQILASLSIKTVAWTSVVLPIGISFFTFQSLTYSVDVYRKVHEPCKKVSDYILFILSFPQMIAGPIVKYGEIADQLVERKETVDDRLIGFYRFVIGLSKKVLIANVMGEQADLIFNANLNEISTSDAWIGILAYTFQIYFDFSGYSDMAIGLGRMIGFHFPENFNSPYISKNISEFWRRWHMTLGTFMREYLYIPLGGNRVSSKSRLFLNLGLVFLLSGLWHGASWNYVLWGAFHGAFLILDRLFLINVLKRIGAIPSMLFTFFIVMMGWVIFRLEDLSLVKTYFGRLFDFSSEWSWNVIPAFSIIVIAAIFFSFFASTSIGLRIQKYFFETKVYGNKEHLGLALLSMCLLILSLSSITSSGFNPFIYFRF